MSNRITLPDNVHPISSKTEAGSSSNKMGGGSSGGNGGDMDKDYIDAKIDASASQLRSDLVSMEARIDSRFFGIHADIVQMKSDMVRWFIGVAAAIVLAMVALLSFGGDRFDGGIAASSLYTDLHRAEKAETDNRLDRIESSLERVVIFLEGLKPQQSTDTPQEPQP